MCIRCWVCASVVVIVNRLVLYLGGPQGSARFHWPPHCLLPGKQSIRVTYRNYGNLTCLQGRVITQWFGSWGRSFMTISPSPATRFGRWPPFNKHCQIEWRASPRKQLSLIQCTGKQNCIFCFKFEKKIQKALSICSDAGYLRQSTVTLFIESSSGIY